MINLFQFAANDKSCSYLVTIFGSMNGVVCNPGTTYVNITMSAMFQTFNSVILAVAAILVVYTTVVGVMMTAHEGEFMGKKWNNIWIPIRMVLGIAALVPLGNGGYSLIQYALMWVLVQGIGAADTLWATGVNAVTQAGSLFAKPVVPAVGVATTLGQLYQGLVCDATARLNFGDPTGSKNGGYYCQNNSGSACSPLDTSNFKCNGKTCSLSLGPKGTCGKFSFCDSSGGGKACSGKNANSLQCAACNAQAAEVNKILPALNEAAQQFANMDYAYRDFYANSWQSAMNNSWQFIYDYCAGGGFAQANCCIPKVSPPALLGGPTGTCSGCASIGATGATCTLAGGAPASSSDTPNVPPPNAGEDGNNAQNLSDDAVTQIIFPAMSAWIPTQSTLASMATNNIDFFDGFATEYASLLSDTATNWVKSQNSSSNTLLNTTINATVADGWILAGTFYYTLAGMNNNNMSAANVTFAMDTSNPAKNSMKKFRNNYGAATTFVGLVTNASAAPGSLSGVSEASGLSGPIGSAMSGVNNSFNENISGSAQTNPLSQLQATGMGMLITVEILFATLLGVTIGLGIAGNITAWALGTGVMNPAGGMLTLMYFIFVPMIFAFFAVMISLGGLLGVYVPLIPYIVFTFGAIGWLLAVVETMVAGPLVAIGIISPSGQHELLGKAEPALMLLFNVFLRPSLMIFGLMAAVFLASVVTTMINAAFWNVASAIGGLGDPLTSILFLAAYVMLIISALNKCFAAISIIPQQVMSWIGGHGQPGGAAGDSQEALGETKGGVATTGSKASGAMEGAKTAGGSGALAASQRGKEVLKKERESPINQSPENKG